MKDLGSNSEDDTNLIRKKERRGFSIIEEFTKELNSVNSIKSIKLI